MTEVQRADEYPVVTVVMPVRDPDPHHFPTAVASVLDQTLEDFELLVVEDAAVRPGEREVRSVSDQLEPIEDRRIRHIKNEEPGIASARNRGLAEARADLVAMLDADDIAAADRLERQFARFENQTDLVVLGTQLHIVDEHGRKRGARQYPSEHEDIVRLMPIYNTIAQPSVMFRKAAVLEIGGYRDRTCEDYDLWSRLARNGARFENVDVALVSYRVHSGAMKSRKLRASVRDTIDIKREHWKGRQGLRGGLRLLGEHGLLLLPPRLVLALFSRLYLRDGSWA